MRVLLAIDDSKFSEAATQALLQQMRPEQTEVCVLHALEPPVVMPYSYLGTIASLDDLQQARSAEAQELVRRVEESLSKAGFKVQTTVAEGDPRIAIIDQAKEWKAELIIVGSHGRRGLDRFLMGSVSESVIRHAPCSVEIVRVPSGPPK
jgi:nucleotide-binding universal stress UspA family protein